MSEPMSKRPPIESVTYISPEGNPHPDQLKAMYSLTREGVL